MPLTRSQPFSLAIIERKVPNCRKCSELREYCAEIAKQKRKAFADWTYWGKPVPAFGDHAAKIMIIGLAPAAHGANRTGRMFTGDRSGDFLYAALHRAGLANQPTSIKRDDGLRLNGVYITAPVRCAPPANKPTPIQLSRCAAFLANEIAILQPRVMICLGAIAWNSTLGIAKLSGIPIPSPRPRFAHGAEHLVGDSIMLGCYHVSQQNTFTGRLTPTMLDRVLQRAKSLAE